MGIIVESETFEDFIAKAGIKLTVVDELNVAGYLKATPNEFFGAMSFGVPAPDNPTGTTRADLVIGKKIWLK